MTTPGGAGDVSGAPGRVPEDAPDADELAARMLHDHGLRPTPARTGVAAALLGRPHHQHLTAPELVDHLHERERPADRATVYRTLNALSDTGLLHTSPTASGATAYGLAATPHHHVVCTRCGVLEPLPAQPLTDALRAVAASTSFEVPVSGATLHGLCPGCRGR